MDFTQYILLGAVIAGVTELINRLRAADYWVAATIVTAAIIGGVFGALELAGVPSIEVGVAAGFGVSGALKGISSVGQKSTPAPSDVLTRKKK